MSAINLQMALIQAKAILDFFASPPMLDAERDIEALCQKLKEASDGRDDTPPQDGH